MYIKEISGSDFEENLDYFTIIDVRSPEEYKNGHVKGAINIAYQEILDRRDEIDDSNPIVLYCGSNRRSEFAATLLMQAGYKHVYIAPGVRLYDYNLIK